jgi:hypothetical protein
MRQDEEKEYEEDEEVVQQQDLVTLPDKLLQTVVTSLNE